MIFFVEVKMFCFVLFFLYHSRLLGFLPPRTCLQTLVENNMHTIAFSCIHSDRKNYLIRDAAPIVLRMLSWGMWVWAENQPITLKNPPTLGVAASVHVMVSDHVGFG